LKKRHTLGCSPFDGLRANGYLRWLVITVAGLMILSGTAAAQQPYPSKPIRFIVPYAPGGSSDLLARLLAPRFTESWGQPVIVDNRPGANTMIGTQALTKAAPDGYTILMMAIAHTIIPNLLPTPYDPIKDFAPIGTVGRGELVLVLHPSVPANKLQELVALAKAKPGQLNYASASTGGPLHLAGELFNMLGGVKTQHIPYKGSGPAMTDLLGGHVHMMFSPPSDSIAHIRSGKLRALAISGNARAPTLPQVPTFAEAGMPGFTAKNWFGVLAPVGTPKPIIDKLSAEIARVLALPDVREKLLGQGMDPYISTPGEFAALLKSDFALYGKIIKSANIKLEN
jgi:tripartite-type tricarboxylate transporter receptor subunit TctC